jgi:two-component system phosphate regulon sensor histidine kinase PhoR
MAPGSPPPARRSGGQLPLQLRLIAALAALVAVVVLATGFLAERALRERETARVGEDLRREAAIVRDALHGLPVAVEHRAELQQIVRRTARSAEARVTLIAADGTVVADSGVPEEALPDVENHKTRPEVVAALQGGSAPATRLSRTLGRRLLYVGVPVRGSASAEPTAVVRLARDLDAVDAVVAELRRLLVTAGGLGLLGALLLSFGLSELVLRPVRQIAEVVGSIAGGDLSRRLPRDTGGELGRIAGSVNDVAEQLHDRLQELTEDRERLHAVLSGMVEGVLVVDSDDRVVVANPRVRRLFGLGAEVVGRPFWEVVRRREVEEAIASARHQREHVVCDFGTETPERRLQLHAVRFPSTGRPAGVVAVFHDVTEIHRLESMRRDFVANVSHELKTPLTAIRGFAETLRGDVPPPQRDAYLDVIQRHSERLASLIDDVLSLSRIEGGRLPNRPTEVDVARVATSLARDMKPQLSERGVSVDVQRKGSPLAWADRRSVEQILTNLLDNAAKYSDAGGRIDVRVEERGRQLRVEVSDAGMGIPPEDVSRIFERFYRVDKARSRDLGGTGLGLAIVKHLAHSQGGEVSVVSVLGEGSTFTVTLPRSPA